MDSLFDLLSLSGRVNLPTSDYNPTNTIRGRTGNSGIVCLLFWLLLLLNQLGFDNRGEIVDNSNMKNGNKIP